MTTLLTKSKTWLQDKLLLKNDKSKKYPWRKAIRAFQFYMYLDQREQAKQPTFNRLSVSLEKAIADLVANDEPRDFVVAVVGPVLLKKLGHGGINNISAENDRLEDEKRRLKSIIKTWKSTRDKNI